MNWREIAAFVMAILILNIRNRRLNHPTSRSMALLVVLLGLSPILSPVANADAGNEGAEDSPLEKVQGGFQIAWVIMTTVLIPSMLGFNRLASMQLPARRTVAG